MCLCLLASYLPLSTLAAQFKQVNSSKELSNDAPTLLLDNFQNENVSLNSTSTASSFTTSTGGTLILNYVGDSSSIAQTCYTKIIYFTAEALSFYQAQKILKL